MFPQAGMVPDQFGHQHLLACHFYTENFCFLNCSLHQEVTLVSVTHIQSRLLQLVQTMEDQLIQQHVVSACIFYQFVESLLASFSRSEIRSSLALRGLSFVWFIRLDIRAFCWYCVLFLLLIVSHNPESLGSHKMMVLNVEFSFCFALSLLPSHWLLVQGKPSHA